MSFFKKASKSQSYAKLAVIGPSGSGKTYGSILLAKGLSNNGLVGVIDTENNSASLYSDKFNGWDYLTLPINPPYTSDKYLKAIDIAIEEGIEVLVIDSLSHVWAAEGGLLEEKTTLDNRGGNTYTNWANITKKYEQLISKILHSKIHLVATMRSKQEYVLQQNSKGKAVPVKVGMAPVMRDGAEYEFTTVFDLGMDHSYETSKDRTGLFDGNLGKLSEDTGRLIRDWLTGEQEPTHTEPKVDAIETNTSQSHANKDNARKELLSNIALVMKNNSLTKEQVTAVVKDKFNKEASSDLTDDELVILLSELRRPVKSTDDSKKKQSKQDNGQEIISDKHFERLRKQGESLEQCKERLGLVKKL